MKRILSISATLACLFCIFAHCSAQTVSFSYSNINDPALRAVIDSLTAQNAYQQLFDTYLTAGEATTQSGATKSAAYYFMQAEKVASEHNLNDALLKVTDRQWRLYEMRGMHREALDYLKRFNVLQKVQEAETAAAVAAEPIVEEYHEPEIQINEPLPANHWNAHTVTGIIIIVLVLVGMSIFFVSRKRSVLKQLSAIEKQNVTGSEAIIEFAAMATEISDRAARLSRTSGKEGSDLSDELLPIISRSNRLSLAASNLVTLQDDAYTIEKEDADIDRILKRAAKEFDAQAHLKGVKIEYKSTGKATVSADQNIMRIALFNMVANALDYAAKGETVSLWIETIGQTVTIGVENRRKGKTAEVTEAQTEDPITELETETCCKAARLTGAKFNVKSDKSGRTATFSIK